MFSEWTKKKTRFMLASDAVFFLPFHLLFCLFLPSWQLFFLSSLLVVCCTVSSEFKSSSIAEFANTPLKCLLQPWLDLPLSFLSTYTVICPQPLHLNFTYFIMSVNQWIRLLFLYFLCFVCLFWFLFVAACLCLAISLSFSLHTHLMV